MGTAIQIEPPAYGLCKNPEQLVFKIISDEYEVTAGVKYQTTRTMTVQPIPGDTIIFNSGFLSNVTFTFVAGTPADCSEVEIGATAADTFDNLLDAWKSNYHVATSYDLSVFATIIGMDYGPTYDITITGTASALLTAVFTQPGVARVIRSDLRIIVDLFVVIGGVDTKALSYSFPVDATGAVRFDVYEVMISYLRAYLPAIGTTNPVAGSGPVVTYFIRHTDYYDDAFHCYHQSSNFRAVLAGFPERRIYANNFSSDYFTVAMGRKFLTRCPSGEVYMPTASPFYLFFYVTTNTTYRLSLVLTYTDGTTSTHYSVKTISNLNTIIVFPAGYDQLGIDALKTPGKTVKSYAVRILNTDDFNTATISSESFTIQVDYDHYEYSRLFLVLNSLGGMDVIHLTGVAQKKIQTTGFRYTAPTPTQNEQVVSGESKSGIKTFTNPYVFATGFKSKIYLDYIQELIKSELVYLVAEKYIEMDVLSNDADLYGDDSPQYGINIDMVEAQINRGWAL